MFADKIHYIEKGEGEPLVLLHGNGEDSSIFVDFIERFSKKYRVIAIDTRGHGKTPMGEEAFSLYQFADDLNEFFVYKNIDKAHILGFSDGGNIAMIFAYKYSDKVMNLVLNGANSNPSGLKTSVYLGMWIVYAVSLLLAVFSRKHAMIRDLYRIMLYEPHISPGELGRITAPTLILMGTKDMIKDSEAEYLEGALPDAELVYVEGGHFILKENFEDYCDAVEKFLEL